MDDEIQVMTFSAKDFYFYRFVQHDIKINDKRVTYITTHNLHRKSGFFLSLCFFQDT